jgi:hypothetical protein
MTHEKPFDVVFIFFKKIRRMDASINERSCREFRYSITQSREDYFKNQNKKIHPTLCVLASLRACTPEWRYSTQA